MNWADIRRRFGWALQSWRFRLLGMYLLLLAVAAVGSWVVLRVVLFSQVDDRIDDALTTEVEELRTLATGNDPATGEPFGSDVERLFRVFLEREVTRDNEVVLTLVDGEPFLRSEGDLPYAIDRDPVLVEQWAATEGSERGSVGTPAGELDYIAVEVGEGAGGKDVMVVAMFSDREAAVTEDAVRWAAVVHGVVGVVLAGLLGWWLTSRMTAPVREMTATARAITDSDLSRRIDVEGDDELAGLAETFNDMLDRLERSFEMQRTFAQDAGHELRTPITIIRGHIELLALDDNPEDRHSTVALVLDELDRMNRMVNDLLTLAQAEQPDFLQRAAVDVDGLAERLRAKVAPLGDRQWSVYSDVDGFLRLDEDRLTQAVLALADNAVHHTEQGSMVQISLRRHSGELAVSVRDQGPGVPLDEQPHIFQRFARAANGKRRTDGAGLGLSIVDAIARAHDGRVELHSRPGHGATFTIFVPAIEVGFREEPTQPVPVPGPAG